MTRKFYPPLPYIPADRTTIYDILRPIFISRFLLDACSLSFTDRKSHMGMPGVDSTVSLGSSEMLETCFNASRIAGNLETTRPDALFDAE